MPDFVEQAVAIVEVVVDFSNQLVHQHFLLVVVVAAAAAAAAAVVVVVKMLQTGFVVVLWK
jgi:hypothetical protein